MHSQKCFFVEIFQRQGVYNLVSVAARENAERRNPFKLFFRNFRFNKIHLFFACGAVGPGITLRQIPERFFVRVMRVDIIIRAVESLVKRQILNYLHFKVFRFFVESVNHKRSFSYFVHGFYAHPIAACKLANKIAVRLFSPIDKVRVDAVLLGKKLDPFNVKHPVLGAIDERVDGCFHVGEHALDLPALIRRHFVRVDAHKRRRGADIDIAYAHAVDKR